VNATPQPDCGPKRWFLRQHKGTLRFYSHVDLPELMTEIEAVHEAATLNERDEGRGVKWVAVEQTK